MRNVFSPLSREEKNKRYLTKPRIITTQTVIEIGRYRWKVTRRGRITRWIGVSRETGRNKYSALIFCSKKGGGRVRSSEGAALQHEEREREGRIRGEEDRRNTSAVSSGNCLGDKFFRKEGERETEGQASPLRPQMKFKRIKRSRDIRATLQLRVTAGKFEVKSMTKT